MQRYFVPTANWQAHEVVITGDDIHHITRVMRYKIGDRIICNHPDGQAAVCTITEIEAEAIQSRVVEWLEESTELPVLVTIAQGLPKGDKLDLILQKGTELGAHAFIPFQAERSVVVWDNKKIDKKMLRFGKIVKEASEQSHRNRIPEIKQPMNLSSLIEESQHFDVKLFAYEEEAKTADHESFGTVIQKVNDKQHVLVCIGPEGGFSTQEAEKLREAGFYSVRLGPRILRTETAAMYVLASISYHFEELGCNECQQ
ncbi:16S rRNA (uracil1498-N3)-methyltransferase [Virgibacillus halotolerans]|uniref:16S rRNA (uracil(1498)-N(3))-methyltransferase n=1 Tax=Virgibacillus halotolerans TaxID=1071053 RepID=UPI001960CDB4|nr:16S rRNA (uracil(1498)-N(3))-methyltransferase [Virgibacillus halotolerans]MBM7597919.1 16S rRNA (uracil1498-N3)-methyltransferase [Virgibacillus halotolerans]